MVTLSKLRRMVLRENVSVREATRRLHISRNTARRWLAEPEMVKLESTPGDRARKNMVIGLLDSYGYGALVAGVAAYHLFPDFVGGKNYAMLKLGLDNGRKLIEFAMKTKGSSPFVAGDLSLADLYLAPVLFYVSLTPHASSLFSVDGFADWWSRVQALKNFQATAL